MKLLENLTLKKRITALDIGSGNGFPITEIAMRLGDSSKIYGIDPWLNASKRVAKKIKLYGITNIEILNGVAESLPFPDHCMDLITSNNGINNVSDLDKVLSECARVMKKGGQLLISMNLNTSLMAFYTPMEEVLTMAGMLKEIKDMHKHIYQKRKPLNEMILKLQDYGFELKKLVKDKFDYTFADGTTMFHHYFIRLAFVEGWKSFVPD
ncbi:MAG: class I SAM-dependent methyltransferase [Bacteroidales bacterium]